MAQKNTVTLICDRCGAKLDAAETWQARGWTSIATQAKPILLCASDSNAFAKFMRGAGVKAVKA